MTKKIFFVLFLFLFVSFSFAQEELLLEEPNSEGVLDDLFIDASEDVVISDTETDYKARFEEPTKLKVSGYFRALGGIASGYVRWPDNSDLSKGLDFSYGAIGESYLCLDAKPDSSVRIKMAFLSSLSPFVTMNWGDFSINELWADYILDETIFFRLGKYTSTWGQGRLFSATNLVSSSDSFITLKASIPSFLSGLSFYSWGSGVINDYQDLDFAVKLDSVFLNNYLSGAFLYSFDAFSSGLLSFKRTIFKTDVFVDAVVKFNSTNIYGFGTAGFFREWNDLKLIGEYYLEIGSSDNSKNGLTANRAGLALGYNNIFDTSIDVGLNIMQSFDDFSGYVVAALAWSFKKYFTLNVAIPFVYGDDGSYYVINNYISEDEDAEASGFDGYRLGLIFKLTFKANFE